MTLNSWITVKQNYVVVLDDGELVSIPMPLGDLTVVEFALQTVKLNHTFIYVYVKELPCHSNLFLITFWSNK